MTVKMSLNVLLRVRAQVRLACSHHSQHLRCSPPCLICFLILLPPPPRYGFIIMDGNGSLFGTLSGNTREILHKFTVRRQGLKSGRAWRLVAGGDTQFLRKCGGRIWSAGGLSDKSG